MKFKNNNIVLLVTVLLGLAACTPRVDYRGKLPDIKNVDKITPGKSTTVDVVNAIGSPTIESSYGPKQWLYIYKKETTKSFLKPKLKEKNVLSISFNDKGVVTRVEDLDPEFSEIDPVKYKTKTVGQDRPMLQQIFSNFGRLARQNESKAK